MPSAAAAASFVLSQVPAFLQHKSEECRRQLQQLLEALWRMLDAAVGSDTAQAAAASGSQILQPEDAQLLLRYRQQVQAALFVLACDRSAAVQGPAAVFWHDTAAVLPAGGPPHTLLLHKSPVQRLTALLQQVSGLKVQLTAVWAAAGVEPALAEAVARDAESRWPCVAAGLLLRLPSEMADAWDRPLFVKDLADCVFTDYPVQTQVNGN
jgi:histone H3/H4